MALPKSCKIAMGVFAVILALVVDWIIYDAFEIQRLEILVAVFVVAFVPLFASLVFLREKLEE